MVTFFFFLAVILITDASVILDSDWVLGELYPFPIDKCIQASPDIAFYDYYPYWIYYECSSDKTTVTKYKWDEATENSICDKSIAATETTTFDGSVTSRCESGFFICDDEENYIKIQAIASSDDTCDFDNPLIDLINPAYAVTSQCFCDSADPAGTYSKFSCNSTTSSLTQFANEANCESDTDGTSTTFAEESSDTCMLVTDDPLNVYAKLLGCIQDDVNVLPTNSPTKIPTGSPTKAPTDDETTSSASTILASFAIFMIVIVTFNV